MLNDSLLKLFKLDNLINNMTGYIEARMELVKLEVKEDLTKALSKLAVFFFLAFAFTLFLIFISIALAISIGKTVGMFGGFAMVAAFYFALAVVLLFFRDAISTSIEKQITEIMKKKIK
jgi:ABC-type Co2+ transport system permease subunit